MTRDGNGDSDRRRPVQSRGQAEGRGQAKPPRSPAPAGTARTGSARTGLDKSGQDKSGQSNPPSGKQTAGKAASGKAASGKAASGKAASGMSARQRAVPPAPDADELTRRGPVMPGPARAARGPGQGSSRPGVIPAPEKARTGTSRPAVSRSEIPRPEAARPEVAGRDGPPRPSSIARPSGSSSAAASSGPARSPRTSGTVRPAYGDPLEAHRRSAKRQGQASAPPRLGETDLLRMGLPSSLPPEQYSLPDVSALEESPFPDGDKPEAPDPDQPLAKTETVSAAVAPPGAPRKPQKARPGQPEERQEERGREAFSDGLSDGLQFELARDGLHRPVPGSGLPEAGEAADGGNSGDAQGPGEEGGDAFDAYDSDMGFYGDARPMETPAISEEDRGIFEDIPFPDRPRRQSLRMRRAYGTNLQALIPRRDRRPDFGIMPWFFPLRQQAWFNLFDRVAWNVDAILGGADSWLATGNSGRALLFLLRNLPFVLGGFLLVWHLVGLLWSLGWLPWAGASLWVWGACWMSLLALPVDALATWRLLQDDPLELPWWLESRLRKKRPGLLARWPRMAEYLRMAGTFYLPFHLCVCLVILMTIALPWVYTSLGGY